MKTLPFVAVAVLVFGLAGCAPAAPSDTSTDSGSSDTDTSDTTEESTETETGALQGAVLAGTGDYTVPDQAPIGGYELPDNPDGQPAGCTWQLYVENGTLFVENQGSVVFITDVIGRFVTDGCPDWVQFED